MGCVHDRCLLLQNLKYIWNHILREAAMGAFYNHQQRVRMLRLNLANATGSQISENAQLAPHHAVPS